MMQNGIPCLVFSSSCTVYGQPDTLPVTEETPLKPAESTYGRTKQMCEDIISDFIKSGVEMKAISLRYFNPIGAHPTSMLGELPRGIPNNLVPFITQTAAGLRDKITVFGNDYDTPDGTCIRDYIHVVDLAKAHVAATERLLNKKNKKPFELFNLGTGRGNTVLEVIHAFEKVTGVKLNYKIGERRAGDVEKVWADATLANTELGWKTSYSLEDIMKSAWKWEQQLAKQLTVKE
jgi:UDP-glucose 4-epimerase